MDRLRLSGPWLLPLLFLIGCDSDSDTFLFGPGSAHVAFVSERQGGQQVYVVAIDGKGLVQVSHLAGNAYSPTWSPDGKLIAFHGDPYGDRLGTDIFTVAPDGTGPKNLTHSHDSADSGPSWSPDGKSIVFDSNRDNFDVEIYMMRADGSGQTRLTFSPGLDGVPQWSPRGDWIAFTSSRDDTAELYVMRPDGSDQRRLTRSYNAEHDPVWAPDGSGLAYSGGNIDTTQIYFVTPDGVNTRLTNNPQSARTPSWSPDGAKIVYNSYDGLHIVNRDGSNDQPIPETLYRNRTPKWSPDGHRIVFVDDQAIPGNPEVVVMKPDGSDRLNLSQNFYADTSPTWEPLGKRWTPRTP